MHNFFLVARHEYIKRVSKRSFLLGVVGFPLLMAAIMGISIFTAITGGSDLPLGYVDHAAAITGEPAHSSGMDLLVMLPFEDENNARASLDQGLIQGYYLIPADYMQTGKVDYFHVDSSPGGRASNTLNAYLRSSLTSGMDQASAFRILEGVDITLRSTDGQREFSSENALTILLPFFGGFLFVISVMMTASYMLQIVADEKENRTMEVLLTSLSPEQLIGGKAAGLIALAFTLISTWLLTAVVGLLFAARLVPDFPAVSIPWSYIGVLLAYFIPSFVLIAGVMTAIGGSVTEMRQGQQVAGILNIFFMLPYFMTAALLASPDSSLALFLTFFPPTAMVTITIRSVMTVIPTWQIAGSWLVLSGAAAFSVWASARIFRAGMLMYGQTLQARAVWKALKVR
jgi:ABC-2 type transport system permease protein